MQVKENKVRDNNYDIELGMMWKSLCRLHSLIIILSFIYALLGVLHYVVYIALCLGEKSVTVCLFDHQKNWKINFYSAFTS